MSHDIGTKISTNGLIFSYDVNNEKSYIGPPIQNMATTVTASGSFSGPGIAYTAGTEVVDIPSLGPMTVPYMEGYNSNSASYCCLNQFYFVNGNSYIAGSGATTYTYSIVYRCTSGYTNANYMYRYEHDGTGAYLGEAGIHDDAKKAHLGDGWYWAWNTFTSNTSTSRIYLRNFYYQYNVLDRLSVARVLVTPGDYTQLHPRLWPAVNTTRTASQTIVDLTRKTSVTPANIVYNANNTFNFSYSGPSYITVPLSTAFNKTEGTMNFWVYPTRYNGGNGYFVNREDSTANATDWFWIGPYSNFFYFRLGNGTSCCDNDLTFSNVDTTIPVNTWTNMCFTWKINGTSVIYKNGAELVSRSIGNIPNTNPASNGRIGLGHANADDYFDGRMPVVQIYNRQLTAAEVRANFNALRGRYGI
jgi:hypothetical protein